MLGKQHISFITINQIFLLHLCFVCMSADKCLYMYAHLCLWWHRNEWVRTRLWLCMGCSVSSSVSVWSFVRMRPIYQRASLAFPFCRYFYPNFDILWYAMVWVFVYLFNHLYIEIVNIILAFWHVLTEEPYLCMLVVSLFWCQWLARKWICLNWSNEQFILFIVARVEIWL